MTDTFSPSHAVPVLEMIPTEITDSDFGDTSPNTTIPSDLAAFLSPPQQPDELGRLGGYRVRKLLGEGGMGYVFLAEDEALQRPVALKVMKPDVIQEENAKERFFREARAAARVRHDHVITIHQVGEDRGIPFLALEYLDGMTLDKALKERGEFSLKDAVRITKEIAAGLHAAHRTGLIHRDIKPANIWLEATDGRVKILDFGLARHLVEDTHLTKTGEVVGTPAFMSPEQARDRAIDHRSDLFSLGIILYRLCTGHQPFHGSTTMAILTSLAVDDPLAPSELNRLIPIYLEQIILRLLEKEASNRIQSAQDLVDQLTAIEKRPGIAGNKAELVDGAPPPSVTHATFKPASKRDGEMAASLPAPTNAAPRAAEPPPRQQSKFVLIAGLAGFTLASAWVLYFKGKDERVFNGRRHEFSTESIDKPAPKAKERLKPVGTAPSPVAAPFDSKQARAYQEAWAAYYDTKMEFDNSIGMPLVLIPPGRFQMGAPETEAGSMKRELPQHDVEITRPFCIGVTEVTQEQYERVMHTNPSKFRKDQGGGPSYPVENVSWHDAVAFCEAMSKLPEEISAGRSYRLPTEAEWEYACRAGTKSAQFQGTRILRDYAWHKDSANNKTQVVRTLQPNPWGLYDMTGNVWEWCSDYYDESYYESKIGKDPQGPTAGANRVMRGGSFAGAAISCRSAYREGLPPGIRNETFGFRVCFTVD